MRQLEHRALLQIVPVLVCNIRAVVVRLERVELGILQAAELWTIKVLIFK